ncbi:MAG: hypothetical protein QF724_04585 [Planctomycetota bacterium]|nr:hypothetical protein [Planctomycetota bacterium]MDP6519210.1 hypothetical protein [Planctomycetota bacterium]MDP6838193.1 hypothetical protein [Planctomycetota bacterium]
MVESDIQESAQKEGSSCGGCLLRGCLGLLAASAGGSVALLVLGPLLLGEYICAVFVDTFNDTYDGTLEVDSYEMAMFGEQSLSGLRLYDPEGREVLSCALTFPGWLSIGLEGDNQLELEGDVKLMVAANGESNLERALNGAISDNINVRLDNEFALDVQLIDSRVLWHSVHLPDAATGSTAGWAAPEIENTILFDRLDGGVQFVAGSKLQSTSWKTNRFNCQLKWAGGELLGKGTVEVDPTGAGGAGLFFHESGSSVAFELEVDVSSDLGRSIETEWAGSLGAAKIGGGRLALKAESLRLPVDGWPRAIHGRLVQPPLELAGGLVSHSIVDEMEPQSDTATPEVR